MSAHAFDLGLSHFGLTWYDTQWLTRDQWEFISRRLGRLKGASKEERQRVLAEVNEVRNGQIVFLSTLHDMSKPAVESYIKVLTSVFLSPKPVGVDIDDAPIVC